MKNLENYWILNHFELFFASVYWKTINFEAKILYLNQIESIGLTKAYFVNIIPRDKYFFDCPMLTTKFVIYQPIPTGYGYKFCANLSASLIFY